MTIAAAPETSLRHEVRHLLDVEQRGDRPVSAALALAHVFLLVAIAVVVELAIAFAFYFAWI